jgi:hypothetical protein
MTESEGLKGSDLLAAFAMRRVLPLQAQHHIISCMSGHRDPCRMCTWELPDVEVARLVNYISNCKLSEMDWRFGKRPYDRAHPPPAVSLIILSLWLVRALVSPSDQSAMVQVLPTQSAAGALDPGQQYMPDRTRSDVEDPNLGAVAMEEDDATGGGGGAGGSGGGGGLEDWPDDDEEENEPRRPHGADKAGAGASAALTAPGGAQKRRAGSLLFGSRPKKPKNTAAVTKRQEAAAKAAQFQKAPKQPPMVSA